MKFQVLFTHDLEYNGYVVEVPALPGCVSQGKTIDEAITNIKDAIQGYLYVQQKYGKNKPILSIPNHQELAPGLLRSLIRQAEITVDEFLEYK